MERRCIGKKGERCERKKAYKELRDQYIPYLIKSRPVLFSPEIQPRTLFKSSAKDLNLLNV
jgi:hypothetical protein